MSIGPDPTAEFDCSECRRHVVSYGGPPGDPYGICMLCMNMPGWFRNRDVRRRLMPDMTDADVAAIDDTERATWPST